MKNGILCTIALLVSLTSWAGADEYNKYNIGDGVFKLPKAPVDAWLNTVNAAGQALQKCEPISLKATNPIIQRTSTWQVTPASNGCRFVLLRESNWRYSCILPKRERAELSTAMISAAKDHSALGDLSEGEQAVLFNPKFCRASQR